MNDRGGWYRVIWGAGVFGLWLVLALVAVLLYPSLLPPVPWSEVVQSNFPGNVGVA